MNRNSNLSAQEKIGDIAYILLAGIWFIILIIWLVNPKPEFEPLLMIISVFTGGFTVRKISKSLNLFVNKPIGKKNTLSLLESKFQNTKFLITDNDKIAENDGPFIKAVASKFIEEVYKTQKSKKSQGSDSSMHGESTRIGFICGPMVYNLLDYLTRNKKLLKPLDFSNLTFVAMNKAGDRDRFYWSANYLVTAFSLLSLSKKDPKPKKGVGIAYSNQPYDRAFIDEARQKVNILFCSAGPLEGPKLAHVLEWHTEMTKINNNLGDITNKSIGAIGDFCLIPINTEGYAVGSEEFKKVFKELIDPFPSFDWIGEIKRNQKHLKVILPIQTGTTEIKIINHVYKITEKESIAKTVLKSGIVDLCILNRSLAENLSLSLGFFLLKETSNLNQKTRTRRCNAFSFTKNTEVTILAYDPYNRLEKICTVNEKELKDVHEQPRYAPDLIISEIPDAANHCKYFNWSTGVGIFRLDVYGEYMELEVDKNVRKPGQWALITYYAVKNALAKFNSNLGKAAIWDMGCGSGVVGILAATNENDKISKILFSDINEAAVSCTRKNTQKHSIEKIIQFECEQGDLFEPAEKSGQLFDVIAFNPPFFPNSMLTHGAENDGGGQEGWELAERYCDKLYNYLKLNGTGILTIADYVDNREILKALHLHFGESNVTVEDRLILYPTKTESDIPVSYEVQKRIEIEEKCNYHFEICLIDNIPFYACNIRCYIAVKK